MSTIELKVKDGYLNNMLEILNGLNGIMVEDLIIKNDEIKQVSENEKKEILKILNNKSLDDKKIEESWTTVVEIWNL